MNKKMLLSLLFVTTLSSCFVEEPTNSSSSSNQNSSITNSVISSESSSDSILDSSSGNEDVSSDIIIDENATKIDLGSYGDYVTSVDGSIKGNELYQSYLDLTEEIESEKNGIIKTKYQKGLLDFFNIDNNIKINVNISNDELLKINECHLKGNEESYRVCDLDISINDLMFHYEDVGIRLKGNTSRGIVVTEDNMLYLRHYKLNFAETFDDEFRGDVVTWTDENALAYREDRTFFGLEKVDIRWNKNKESTYIREYYAYEMYRNNGMLAPHTNPFNLSFNIDGTTQNAGVYLAVEPIDKDFLKRNLAKDYRDGDLYKMGWSNVGATLDSTKSSLFGVETQVVDGNKFKTIKYPYDLKTNKKTSTHADIKNFITLLNNTSASDFETMLKENTNYEMLMKYFAITYLLADPDDLRGNFNNTYLYFIPKTETTNALAVFIPTDHDRVLGSTGGDNPLGHHGVYTKPFDSKTGYSENKMPLYKKSILTSSNTTIREDYLNAIEDVIESSFMDIETFKSYYDKAKTNYGDCITLGERYKDSDVAFNLVENNNVTDNWNLSIEKFFKEKINTVNEFLSVPTPLGYDIVLHYLYSGDKYEYTTLDVWSWDFNSNGSGMASNWTGVDDYGAYLCINSADYKNPNNIGFLIRSKGKWDWKTEDAFIKKGDYTKDANGVIHIYSKNDNSKILLYETIEKAMGN